MQVEREWSYDELTAELTEAVFSALHRDEDFRSLEVAGEEVFPRVDMPNEGEAGGVRVVINGRGGRRFQLKLIEEVF